MFENKYTGKYNMPLSRYLASWHKIIKKDHYRDYQNNKAVRNKVLRESFDLTDEELYIIDQLDCCGKMEAEMDIEASLSNILDQGLFVDEIEEEEFQRVWGKSSEDEEDVEETDGIPVLFGEIPGGGMLVIDLNQ